MLLPKHRAARGELSERGRHRWPLRADQAREQLVCERQRDHDAAGCHPAPPFREMPEEHEQASIDAAQAAYGEVQAEPA